MITIIDKESLESLFKNGGMYSLRIVNRINNPDGSVDADIFQLLQVNVFPCACLIFKHKRKIYAEYDQNNSNTVFDSGWKAKNVHVRRNIPRIVE